MEIEPEDPAMVFDYDRIRLRLLFEGVGNPINEDYTAEISVPNE
jgi:hypothetical protein